MELENTVLDDTKNIQQFDFTTKTVRKLDELKIINVFQTLGVLPTSVKCPECGDEMFLQKDGSKDGRYIDGYFFICKRVLPKKQQKRHKKRTCRKCMTIRTNTLLTDSKYTLYALLTFAISWVAGNSLTFARRQEGICASTAIKWNAFFRDVVVYYMMENTKPIGGPGKVVEINEYKFCKRKYNREHNVDGQWVFGGIEHGNSANLFLVTVEKRDAATLLALIEKWILPGSKVVSNGWKAYSSLGKLGDTHENVNHRLSFINKNGEHTNTIEEDWFHVKACLPPYNRRNHMFTAYLSKYILAKICKHTKKDAVEALFRTAVQFHTISHPFTDKFLNDNDNDIDNDFDDNDNDLGDDNDTNIDLYRDNDLGDNDLCTDNDKNMDLYDDSSSEFYGFPNV